VSGRATGRRLLLVEDDARFRDALGASLRERGFTVVEAGSVAAATTAATTADEPFDFAVVDLRLGDGSGLDAVRALALAEGDTRIVVLTGWGSIATALEAVRLGAHDFLAKPITAASLVAVLEGRATTESSPGLAPETTPTPTLDRVEWEHIHRVLQQFEGNVSQAARELGLHRRSLQRKLRKRPPQW
jgi:two-component system response regulator RegA